MHSGPVENVLLVHGYSVRTLNSWGRLPALLQADGMKPESIYLSAFVSLDDHVSCADLAWALEKRIAALERDHALDLGKTAIICHSTGAIVARRWLLDRRNAGGITPSHLISCAGANHGSTLAQLGRTELAHVFRGLTEHTDVGQRVLEDLDYGSDFLRTLNREWLDAWNDAKAPLWRDVWCFSMIGTDHRFWQNQLTWQSREPGSDGTVRISAANLNYRIIDVVPPYTQLKTSTMDQAAAHLIVETAEKRYSHTSQAATDTKGLVLSKVALAVSVLAHPGAKSEPVSSVSYGILEGILTPDERPFVALNEAFSVQDETAYKKLAGDWATQNATWTAANADDANSIIVVAIRDAANRLVDDSMVLIRDETGSIQNITASLIGQPIKNQLSPSVVSFYVNATIFRGSHPHRVYVEARTDTPYVAYSVEIDAEISNVAEHSLEPNEVTYVDVHALRDSSGAFAFYRFADPALRNALDVPYPPFPEGNL